VETQFGNVESNAANMMMQGKNEVKSTKERQKQ